MAELLMVSIGIGLLVSLAFGEMFAVTAGGMIVPGYIALFLDRPLDVALTLAASVVTFLVVRAVSKVAVIYGRRRTVLAVLTGYLVGVFARWAAQQDIAPDSDLSVIGYIIPGLIAIWIERQGFIETLSTLISASVLVRLSLIVLGLL